MREIRSQEHVYKTVLLTHNPDLLFCIIIIIIIISSSLWPFFLLLLSLGSLRLTRSRSSLTTSYYLLLRKHQASNFTPQPPPKMHYQSFLTFLLAAAPLATAHGKIAVAQGDAGGNGTALGIQGGVIPGAGKNKVTEPDTTVFKGDAASGCGRTNGQGDNDIEAGTKAAMALSGSTLPQITPGGSLSGTLHIVTSDGAGPYKAMINTDGTASSWTALDVVTQVPGKNGNIRKNDKRWWARALQSAGVMKRATNINEDYPFKVAIPAGTTCTGTVAGQANACIVKLVNPSNAGPFGGCVPVQMVGGNGTAAAAPAAARRARTFEA
jgi:hypothetical protein